MSASDSDTARDAVALARAFVESEVLGVSPSLRPDERFSERRGVFVTLSSFPSDALRGCIGFPTPVLPLGEALEESARAACHDPRFPDLAPEELPHIIVEVTMLSVPHRIIASSPEAIEDFVEIGRDGLMIELMGFRGVLLPQVPVENGWDAGTFLEHLSLKAGLPRHAWRDPRAALFSFSGTIWKEPYPGGTAEQYHG